MTVPNAHLSLELQLEAQIALLEEVPKLSTVGFHNIANHMGDFSASFASGSSRSTSTRERIGIDKSELGLAPLRKNLQDIYREITGYFKSLESLVTEKNVFTSEMEKITSWALALEQDSFLPPMVDQVRGDGPEILEQQTLGAIVDSLMRQTRPLIQETITSSKDAAQVMRQLTRHINVDLDTSKHSLSALRKNTTATLRRMSSKIGVMDRSCLKWEEQTDRVNTAIFEMVGAMQYDDITAQRIEHVVHAMRQAAEKIPETKKKKSKDKAARWFVLVMRISNDQLREIGVDLVSAVHTMHERLTAIADVAEEQKRSIAESRSSSMDLQNEMVEIDYNASTLMRMRVFDESLTSEVLRTLSQAENSVYQARRALEMLILIAKRLQKMVSEMNTGENGRLETLSGSIEELSSRILAEGSVRMDALNDIAEKLLAISLNFSEKITPRLMRTNSMLRRVPLVLQQIGAANGDVMALMNENLAETQSTFTQIMLLSAEMTFHTQIQYNLDRVIGDGKLLQSEVAGDKIVDELRNGDLSELAKEFDDLANMYTMASERRVHEAALGEEGGDDGGGDDDIELF